MSNLFSNHLREHASLSLPQYANFQNVYFGVNIFYDEITASGIKEILFIPPTSNKRAFASVEINGDHGHLSWTYQIASGVVSDLGDSVVATTRDLENITVSEMNVYTDPTWDDTGATLINRGMAPQDGPKGSTNPFAQSQDFFKLNPAMYYIFKIQNRSTTSGVFVLNFTWFEFDPNIGKIGK